MTYRRRVDTSHAEVCQTFRAFGWTWEDTFRLGRFVDGVVCPPGSASVYLIEAKTGKKKLSAAQRELSKRLPVHVVRDSREAEAFMRRVRMVHSEPSDVLRRPTTPNPHVSRSRSRQP